MNDGAISARAWFERLCEAPDAERRRELASLAERDPGLAAQVVELLAADRAAPHSFLLDAEPLHALLEAVPTDDAASRGPTADDRVGPYRLVSRLGRGGMGEVWRAERADGQFEQTVALKLALPDLHSGEILRRFLAERQILARLDHPNIARLLDGGIAADGRPFFALELVEGEPITRYAELHALDLASRLLLIVDAGRAIAAAHSRLVVHRDLKPSNILVGHDGRVRLLDFGIAKLLDAEGDEDGGPRTRVLPMTPAYAAPEQIRGEPVSTGTDVYALGVVLFELVTGRRPFLRQATTAEALAEEIRHETAPRASSSVSQAAGGKRRARRLRGGLDLILARALHPDPTGRYPSCEALVNDLQRFLDRRPVLAGPAPLRYRLGRFASRNRVAVAAGIAVLLALTAGLGLAIWQRSAALAAAVLARQEAAHARAEAKRAEKVQQFLLSIFAEADPLQRQRGAAVSVDDLLTAAMARLPKDLAGQPEVEAKILAGLSRVLANLGRKQESLATATRSVALFRHSLPPGDPAIAAGLDALQFARWNLGRAAAADRAGREALSILVAAGDGESEEADDVRGGLMIDANQLGRPAEALEMERELVASIRRRQGDDAATLVTMGITDGALLVELGRFAEAESSLRSTLALAERLHGPEHVTVAYALMNLADALGQLGRHAEADPPLARALAILEKQLGRASGLWGDACRQRADGLRALSRAPEAAALGCPPPAR